MTSFAVILLIPHGYIHIHEVIEDIDAKKTVISAAVLADTAAGRNNDDYNFVLYLNKRVIKSLR